MLRNRLKTKDFILIALLTALYMILYMFSMLLIAMLGPFGHAISPGICSLFSGTVLYFMVRKIGKMWEYTILTVLVMACFTLMGGGYIPWYITSIGMAVLADCIASRKGKNAQVWQVALASGLLHVGQAWGAIIPSLFFVEHYKSYWILKGQTAEEMDSMIRYTGGLWGILSSFIVLVLAVLGVYIAHAILKKHFREVGNENV